MMYISMYVSIWLALEYALQNMLCLRYSYFRFRAVSSEGHHLHLLTLFRLLAEGA